ncbi:MAG: hypothetical protein KAS98_11740 [Deltaproteobacteria bacterium]|nr:hypothetical protein [Deltaproteobacteria bacterium]
MKERLMDVVKWWLIIAGVAFAYTFCKINEPIPKYTCYAEGAVRLNRFTGEAFGTDGKRTKTLWRAEEEKTLSRLINSIF